MKTFIIDYKVSENSTDFACVKANSKEDAVRIFRNAGTNWYGRNYAEVEIIDVFERF